MALFLTALLDGEWEDMNFFSLGFTFFNIIILPPPPFISKKEKKQNQTLPKNPQNQTQKRSLCQKSH